MPASSNKYFMAWNCPSFALTTAAATISAAPAPMIRVSSQRIASTFVGGGEAGDNA